MNIIKNIIDKNNIRMPSSNMNITIDELEDILLQKRTDSSWVFSDESYPAKGIYIENIYDEYYEQISCCSKIFDYGDDTSCISIKKRNGINDPNESCSKCMLNAISKFRIGDIERK